MVENTTSAERSERKPSERDGRALLADRRNFLKAIGVGSGVALAGCTGGVSGGGGSNTFKIGAIYPLSGGLAELGQSMKQLCQNAVDVVNNQHSDLGPLALAEGEGLTNHGNAEIELTVADHRADPGQGRSEAERMVQEENVDLLYGCFNSSVTSTVSQVAEREGVPHVNGESSSPDLTERGLNWFWRTGPHDITYTQNMFQMINGLNERADEPIETAAIIHEDTEFGSVSARVQKNLCEENGLEVVSGPISYTAESVSSFSSEIQRIQKADPDVLFPSSYVKDAILMAEEMRKQNYMPPLILAQDSGHSSGGFVNKAEISNYFCSRMDFTSDMPQAVPEMGTYRDFVTSNSEVGNSDFAALVRTWGGLICALNAVNQADSFEPGAIQTALNELQMDRLETGLIYGIDFQENHQNAEASGVVGQFVDSDSKLVWPFDLSKEGALEYPAPEWNAR